MHDIDQKLDKVQAHVDHRFDKLESKLDGYATETVRHGQQIAGLQGHAKLIISILIACAGFFALAFFTPGA